MITQVPRFDFFIAIGLVLGLLAVAQIADWEEKVITCSSGFAVTNPSKSTELVADCETLLSIRDDLQGSGDLHWAANTPMADWAGVTIAGPPQRVTGLNLSGMGLDGYLTGLLGDLTGLTTLDLSANHLTGRLPSKLARLTRLRNVSLAGTSFVGCMPPVLVATATNDVTASGLHACDRPPLMSYDTVLTPGTYRVTKEGRPFMFDVPEGLTLQYHAAILARRTYMSLEDPVTGAQVWIDISNENSGGPSSTPSKATRTRGNGSSICSSESLSPRGSTEPDFGTTEVPSQATVEGPNLLRLSVRHSLPLATRHRRVRA